MCSFDRLFNSIAIFLCFFFLGLGIFMGVEKAPFLKALFYVVTSMTTVGCVLVQDCML